MIEMTICDNCDSTDVAKKGVRYNASGPKQKFFCHNCNRWFVIDDGFKWIRLDGKTPAEAAELSLPLGKNRLLDLIRLARRIEMTKC